MPSHSPTYVGFIFSPSLGRQTSYWLSTARNLSLAQPDPGVMDVSLRYPHLPDGPEIFFASAAASDRGLVGGQGSRLHTEMALSGTGPRAGSKRPATSTHMHVCRWTASLDRLPQGLRFARIDPRSTFRAPFQLLLRVWLAY